jgi:hypothetical protein
MAREPASPSVKSRTERDLAGGNVLCLDGVAAGIVEHELGGEGVRGSPSWHGSRERMFVLVK